MAEAMGAPRFDRRILLFSAIVIVILLTLVFIFIRSCGMRPGTSKEEAWPVLYSNLDLKDSAEIIARLKELRIPYDIREQGHAIAIPEDRIADARIGLAQEDLPKGRVGWEIFDEARLGATDFDRRIQLIRAISGELSKTIAAIDVVDDARVQIVIPETRLFGAAAAPVTASVLIRLKPGKKLTQEQVRGIINLVANSVENLNPANVSIVDIHGNLLTGRPPAKVEEEGPKEALEEVEKKEAELEKKEAELKRKEAELRRKEAEKALTPEEKAELRLRTKMEFEESLTTKAQTLLNQFYPPNSVIVKVNIDLEEKNKSKSKSNESIKKITVVILVDNRLELTPKLKKDTYKTVQAAVGYDSKRGDQIILRAVPFHLATPPPEQLRKEMEVLLPPKTGILRELAILRADISEEGLVPAARKFVARREGRNILIGFGGAVIALFVFIFVLRRLFMGRPEEEEEEIPEEEVRAPKAEEKAVRAMERVKDIADSDPERMAELLKSWLTEES